MTTLQEAIDLKKSLEEAIRQEVTGYCRITGLLIDDIDLIHHPISDATGTEVHRLYDVKVHVSI